MPLSEKVRIEVYLPDVPRQAYLDLLERLEQEFTYTFGGCAVIQALVGSYLSEAGLPVQDRINLIYTDTPYAFAENFQTVSTYADKLKTAVAKALDEETVLITVATIYHAE